MNTPPAANPLDVLWRPPALIAIVLATETLALLLALAPGAGGDRWVYFGLASLMAQWIAASTLLAIYLLRHPLSRLDAQRIAWTCLGLLLLSTWLVAGAAWVILGNAWSLAPNAWQGFFLHLTAIALAVGVLALIAFQNYWQARRLVLRAKQLELESLRARIRPHFLFNTLNTGAALVHARPGDAERVLLDLADLFRAALSGRSEVTLSEELELTRRYLEIEALRLGERMRLTWTLPGQLPEIMVPTLSLQPLAENAIRHGIEPLPGGGRIEIEVAVRDRQVVVIVSNDMGPGKSDTSGHRIGLASARERLLAMGNDNGGVDTRVVEGRYVATVTLPLRT